MWFKIIILYFVPHFHVIALREHCTLVSSIYHVAGTRTLLKIMNIISTLISSKINNLEGTFGSCHASCHNYNLLCFIVFITVELSSWLLDDLDFLVSQMLRIGLIMGKSYTILYVSPPRWEASPLDAQYIQAICLTFLSGIRSLKILILFVNLQEREKLHKRYCRHIGKRKGERV